VKPSIVCLLVESYACTSSPTITSTKIIHLHLQKTESV